MTEQQRRENATKFYNDWKNKGNEDEDTFNFWYEFFEQVLGVDNITKRIDSQKKVKIENETKKIDLYIPETNVLIEQKSYTKSLDKKYRQSDGTELTPFEQGYRYSRFLPHKENAKFIIACNFQVFEIHDMDKPKDEPVIITLEDMRHRIHDFDFMFNKEIKELPHDEEVIKARSAEKIVKKLYNAFYNQYKNIENDKHEQNSLNKLIVRIVFCLYAEDAEIFDNSNRKIFHDYLNGFNPANMRKALIDLFNTLNTPENKRDPYDTSSVSKFPYVNGGLFADEDILIPEFTPEIRETILNEASSNFDWSDISPTIFGAMFESTLNPDTRHDNGMHYTSIENIHKVIDSLFLDDLNNEFNTILDIKENKNKTLKLKEFQTKIANLKFLDPACGSGNFLTETYRCLRRLENNIIKELDSLKKGVIKGQQKIDDEKIIKVNISQFYGIEINDFAVTVAKAAMWIAESQAMHETENIVHNTISCLPLETNAFIVEENALTYDWNKVIEKGKLNYIIGNPPFVGARIMSKEQKTDMLTVFGDKWKNLGDLDYVCAWYKKAYDYIKDSDIRCALVSTNSICQGSSVGNLWAPLFKNNIEIIFAHRTFRWDNEASEKAAVYCVIVGFRYKNNEKIEKKIYDDNSMLIVKNINGYLIDGDNIAVESRNNPLCNIPEIGIGNKPIDDGNYLFTEEEKNDFIKKEPKSEKYFKRWYGSEEFINNKIRYCLWLGDCEPHEFKSMPLCMERVNNVKKFRENSKSAQTIKLAQYPTRFHVENMPNSNFLLVPRVSSEKRRYIPIGFMDKYNLVSDAVQIIPDATLYHFAILTSENHMNWMRAVAGRLEMRYRYSKDIVYNNFPWPIDISKGENKLTDNEKSLIKKGYPTIGKEGIEILEKTGKAILDARNAHKDSSLADLYDERTMPTDLRKAHIDNDKAVMQVYGFKGTEAYTSETQCVAELFKMYKLLTNIE